MANNTVSIGIDVSDNGSTVNLIKKVKNLKDLLTQTAAIASSINVGGISGGISGTTTASAGSGGTRSSRAAAGRAPTSTTMASAPSGTYAQARAAVGTGAGARDFARESEGLGGLVRIYATFAANIFAATMAFSALSKAMDTTNMIAGLDQLGAQSGKSLGAVAKNLVAATGGAISLREAMTATAQASAAGMSSKDIIRMGTAAKNASAILGVDMTDALSRLSRGITKLEPELLDELGIFTKIGQSSEAYASKLGKSTAALTDFEKRQGFANAVLAEAESKFGAIKVDVNPYAQLSAALKNVSQTSLEFVNQALGPLVKLLSESPTALLSGLALIGGILIKQAIPALSQFGSKLHQTADDARERATSISETLRNLGPSPSSIGGFDLQRVALERIERQAIATSTKFRVLSNAVDNTKLLGATSAFKLLRAEIAATGTALTGTQQKMLMFKGVAAIGVAAVGTLSAAFGGVIAKIAGVIAVLGLLGSWFGNNAKQSAATSSSLDTLDDAIKNVDRTITAINAKPLLQQLTADSLAARGTAFTELTTGMIDSVTKAEEEITSRNRMDKITNWFASWIDKDTETKLAKNLTTGFEKAFKIAGSTVDLTEFKAQFAELLNLNPSASTGAFLAALKTATPEVKALAATKLNQLSAEFNTVAQRAKDFNAQMMATSKLYDEIALKYQVTDSSAKFGEQQAKSAMALNLELQDTTTAIAAMVDISQDLNKLRLFDPKSAEMLMGLAPELKNINEQYAQNNKALDEEADKLAKINAQIQEKKRLQAEAAVGAPEAYMEYGYQINRLENQAKPVQAEVSRRQEDKKGFESTLSGYTANFAEAARKTFLEGSARVSAAILEGFNKAKLVIQEATLSLFPDNKATIIEQASIAKAQIASDLLKLKSDQSLIDSQEALRIAYETTQQEKSVKEGTISASTDENLTAITNFEKSLMGAGKVTQATIDKFTALSAKIAVAGVTQAEMNKLNSAQALLNRRGGIEGAIRVKQAEGTAVDIKKDSKIRAEESKETIRLIDAAISGIDRAQQIMQQRAGGMTVPEGIVAQQSLTGQKRAEEFTKAQQPIVEQIRESAIAGKQDQLLIAQKNLANLKVEQSATEATAKIVDQMVSSRAEIADIIGRQNKVEDDNVQILNLSSQVAKSNLDFAGQQLDYDLSINKITQDEYDNQKRLNALKQIEIDYANALLAINTKDARARQGIQVQLDTEGTTGAKKQQLYGELDALDTLTAAEKAAAGVTKDLNEKNAKMGEERNQRTKTYADAFNNTVNSMSDALVDFALTGKASFGDMIKSMIIDLIKFEQRQAMMAAFQGAGGSGGVMGFLGGIASSVGSALFGGAVTTESGFSSVGAVQPGATRAGMPVYPAALGGVYDQGRTAFAKGGAFSNTIVTKPTTFAFAKGAGLMGESGPEAIMPLKRGANGSLGVQGGGGSKVDVVVNNFGSEKATTKETTDSRGNRKIEVIIGEMTAAEMTRPNSPVQTSMRSTFGLAPSLTRR